MTTLKSHPVLKGSNKSSQLVAGSADTEQLDLGEAPDEDDPIPDLVGHSITYRIAVGPHRGRKVFKLQTLPICDEEDWAPGGPGNVAGFSLHAGVAVKACQHDKLERILNHLASKDLPGLWTESRAPPVRVHRAGRPAERTGLHH